MVKVPKKPNEVIDQYIANVMAESLGMTDSGTDPALKGFVGIPEGAGNLSSLPPTIALGIAESNADNESIPPSVRNSIIKAQQDRVASDANQDNVLGELRTAMNQFGFDDATSDAERREIIESNFGSAQNFLAGTTSNDAGLLGSAFSATKGLINSKYARGRAAKDQLAGVKAMEAYNNLKGAGAISNFELQQARTATTFLLSPSATDEQAMAELEKMNNILRAAEYRKANNIHVADDSGQEWRYSPGQPPQRVYTSFDPATGNFTVNEVPANEDVYNLPYGMSESDARNAVSSIPSGKVYIYKGQAYRKQ